MRTLVFLDKNILYFTKRFYWYRKGYSPSILDPGQYRFPKRQVPECGRRTFDERKKELSVKAVDMASLDPVDIGLPYKFFKYNQKPEKNTHLEQEAKKRTLKIPLNLIHSPSEDVDAPKRRLLAAQHYDIFNALFGPPHFFTPIIDLGISYPYTGEHYDNVENSADSIDQCVFTQPVYSGNFISPRLAMCRPWIDLTSAPEAHSWTLLMTCPDEPIGVDGRFPATEYVHWMVINISSSQSDTGIHGDEVIPYLPPLPYQGTGYHRYIFVLYQQLDGPLDLNNWRKTAAKGDLYNEREFNTFDFYHSLQSRLTPAGLAFFQSSWDESVRQYYRETLDTLEPVFELDWPQDRLPPQEKYPEPNWWNKPRRHPHGIPLIRERFGAHNDVSFDVYLDRYRDRKEIFEEIVLRRLSSEGNPLDEDEPRRHRYEYPAAVNMPKDMPSWWRRQEYQRRTRQGRWKHLDGTDG